MSKVAFSRIAVIGSQVVVASFGLQKALTNSAYYVMPLMAITIIALEAFMLYRERAGRGQSGD